MAEWLDMRPRKLLIALALVGALIALLYWRGRGSRATRQPALRAAVFDAGGGSAPGSRAAPERERPRELADAAAETPPDITVMRLGLDDAHEHLKGLIAPCFAKTAAPKGKHIVFRYRLLVVDHHAELERPEIAEADFDLGVARACMITAIDEAAWTTTLPDIDTPIEDQLTGDEL